MWTTKHNKYQEAAEKMMVGYIFRVADARRGRMDVKLGKGKEEENLEKNG